MRLESSISFAKRKNAESKKLKIEILLFSAQM
jgi:hypothetical protein